MTIGVSAVGEAIDARIRAYAEFRLFSRLTPSGHRIREAAIALLAAPPLMQTAVCTISVTLHAGGRVRVSARAPRIYDAIDQAVEQAATGVLVS